MKLEKPATITIHLVKPGRGTKVRKVRAPKVGRVLEMDKQASYLLDDDRMWYEDHQPHQMFISGKAEAVDPYGHASAVTSDELDELSRSRHVQEVHSGMQSGLKENLPWMILGGLALAIVIIMWAINGVNSNIAEMEEEIKFLSRMVESQTRTVGGETVGGE